MKFLLALIAVVFSSVCFAQSITLAVGTPTKLTSTQTSQKTDPVTHQPIGPPSTVTLSYWLFPVTVTLSPEFGAGSHLVTVRNSPLPVLIGADTAFIFANGTGNFTGHIMLHQTVNDSGQVIGIQPGQTVGLQAMAGGPKNSAVHSNVVQVTTTP